MSRHLNLWGVLALALSLSSAPLSQAQDIRVPASAGGGAFDPAAPGPIGGTTPAAGTFTTLTGNTSITSPGNITTSSTGAITSNTTVTATTDITLGATGAIYWSGRTRLRAPSVNGAFAIETNNASAGFTLGVGATSGIMNLGGINSGSPGAAVLSVAGCRAGTDTNCAAPDMTLQNGVTTGTATFPGIVFKTQAATVGSGTGAQTLVTSFTIKGGVPIRPSSVVGSLPTCDAARTGGMAWVTDANATTFLSTVAGGGANKVPVSCDGTNWVIG